MHQELHSIIGRIHNICYESDEARELEFSLNEVKRWLLVHAPKEERWQWRPESIISNLDFYFCQVDNYTRLDAMERRRQFPLLKASIEMQLKEIVRFLA